MQVPPKSNSLSAVVILGKGHESGQEVHGTITPFDDRLQLAQEIESKR